MATKVGLVLQQLYDGFHYVFLERRDDRIKTLPLIESTWQVPAIVGLYLLFTLKIGPQHMKNRPPYELKKVMLIYNVVQIIGNGWLFVEITWFIIEKSKQPDINYICVPVDYSATPQGFKQLHLSYAYHLLKLLDLVDTIFFVLRKKQSHVSFLHVYHHSVMVLMTYVAMHFIPGGNIYILCMWNTLVHTVMYSYYYLASYGSKWAVMLKKNLTRLQLLQFIHLGILAGAILTDYIHCDFPVVWVWIGFSQTIVMLVMFMHFYIKTYMSNDKKSM